MFLNHVGGVMVCMLASSVVDCEFMPVQVKPKTIKLFFVASSAKHAALGRKSKDLVDLDSDNVSKWDNMSIC